VNPEAGSTGFASVNQAPAVKRLRVLTVKTHKGFTAFNRRFILPKLREAVRSTQGDIVFLQEVVGSHDRHAALSRLAADLAVRIPCRQHVERLWLRPQRGVSRRPPRQCAAHLPLAVEVRL
jgi:endonuclease/exonuclease/phosphatase family metal-dependent hydrolase